MKRLISLLLLLCAGSVFGATGDITGINVETNGWVMEVFISGYNTNNAFSFGLDADFKGTSAVTVNVGSSQGFDDTGALISVTRTLAGTKQLRLPTPNQALNDVTGTPNIVIRLALSDYIYSTESNITATISANWYSNNAAVSAAIVTNNSTLLHPKCIANWSWPGWQRINGNTMTVRAVGFHRSAKLGRPLRMMQFVARDTHSHAVTNQVLAMTVDKTMPDPVSISEYVANLDISTFTEGDAIRCDFEAYPWVGDLGSVMDTMDGVNNAQSGLYSPITNYCDNAGTYSSAIAVVDPAGNDTNGRVSTNSDPTSVNSAQYFLTIGKAANFLAATNNQFFGHNDCGGGVIYLKAGSYQWTGATTTYGNAPGAWLAITNYPGQMATIGSQANNNSMANMKLHLWGLTITNNSSICFDGMPYVWTDGCIINDSQAGTYYLNVAEYWTYNTITNLKNGIRAYDIPTTHEVLVRGNTFIAQNQATFCYTVLGNVQPVTNNGAIQFQAERSTMPNTPVVIFAYNKIMGNGYSGDFLLKFFNQTNASLGAVFAQNVLEAYSNVGQALLWLGADSSIATPITNVLIWNNTLVGQRVNIAYNDAGSTAWWRYLWSKKNNNFEDDNIKTDIFGTANAARIGNWSEVWGVGHSGNFLGNITNIGTLNFSHTNSGGLPGLISRETESSSPFALNYQQFVSRAAYTGSASGAGNGNYRMLSTSPLMNWGCEWLLPYDIEGNARGGFDPPGAYASASPRKGAGFFQ